MVRIVVPGRILCRLVLPACFTLVWAVMTHADGHEEKMTMSAWTDKVTISGAYLGLYNNFEQDNRRSTDSRRAQFEAAANIDLGFMINERVSGIAQLEVSSGNGSLGLTGNNYAVGDLFATVRVMDNWNFDLSLGQFDIPFGEERNTATGNAATMDNSFINNSLLYSMFGAPTGWGGTVGMQGDISNDWMDASLAITNGTSGDANNADGNYMFTGSLGTNAIVDGLRVAGSYMTSDDREASGNTGLNANLKAWIGDIRYNFYNDKTHLQGYYGSFDFGDDNPSTRDGVSVWMAEGAFGMDRWQIAARLSAWESDDNDGTGAGMSAAIPNPGLGIARNNVAVVTDQDITRLQIGVTWDLFDDVRLKGEWFRDDYDRLSTGLSTDVDGFVLGLNGAF